MPTIDGEIERCGDLCVAQEEVSDGIGFPMVQTHRWHPARWPALARFPQEACQLRLRPVFDATSQSVGVGENRRFPAERLMATDAADLVIESISLLDQHLIRDVFPPALSRTVDQVVDQMPCSNLTLLLIEVGEHLGHHGAVMGGRWIDDELEQVRGRDPGGSLVEARCATRQQPSVVTVGGRVARSTPQFPDQPQTLGYRRVGFFSSRSIGAIDEGLRCLRSFARDSPHHQE